MPGTIPVSVNIGAQVHKRYSVGDSIEARFANILKPEHLSEGCFMCGSEDEEFRAAVGGLILSYAEDSPEQRRIAQEMQGLQRINMMLQAAQLGMGLTAPDLDEDFKAVGLVGLWHSRQKR